MAKPRRNGLFLLLLVSFVIADQDQRIALKFPPIISVSLNSNANLRNGVVPGVSMDVPVWCEDDSENRTIFELQNSWSCAKLNELLICIFAGFTRQFCLPLSSWKNHGDEILMGAPRIDIHHLPIGEVGLVARLMWVHPNSKLGDQTVTLVSESEKLQISRDQPWNSEKAETISQLLTLERSIATTGLRLGLLRHGPMLFNVHDAPAGESLELLGEWEESVVRLLVSVLREGDVVIDVGAHLGSFTLPFARAVGTSGKVIAFEPQVDLYQSLNANLALNGIFNVESHRLAVSNSMAIHKNVPMRDASVGTSNFGAFSLSDVSSSSQQEHSSDDDSQLSRKGLSQKLTTTIRTIILDEFLQLPLEKCPRLIKVDVEGFEKFVLKGSRSLISQCHPLLYLENQCASTTDSLLVELHHQGYTCFWDPAPYYSADNVMNYSGPIHGPLRGVSLNMLCLFSGDDDLEATSSSSTSVRNRDLWTLLSDITSHLCRVLPGKHFVEDYHSINVRQDAADHYFAEGIRLKMADC